MTDVLIYSIFFGTPLVAIIIFGICLYCFISAKKANKANPGTFSNETIKKRKLALIITSIVAGAIVFMTISIMIEITLAIAYM